MRPQPAKPGVAAALAAVLLLAQIAWAGLLLRASQDRVFFFGIPVGGVCLFRQITGLPCPACGMTRSIVLTLHGHAATALRLNLAGPLWVLAVVSIAGALLWLAWRQRSASAAQAEAAKRRVWKLALVQGAVVVVLLATNWIHALLWRG